MENSHLNLQNNASDPLSQNHVNDSETNKQSQISFPISNISSTLQNLTQNYKKEIEDYIQLRKQFKQNRENISHIYLLSKEWLTLWKKTVNYKKKNKFYSQIENWILINKTTFEGIPPIDNSSFIRK